VCGARKTSHSVRDIGHPPVPTPVDASPPRRGRDTQSTRIRKVSPVTDQTPSTPARARSLPLRGTPNEGVTDWPNTPSSDPAAEKVRRLAHQLAVVMQERNLSARAVARMAGIGIGTVQVIQHGNRWPDSRAVARLEVALDTALWPSHESGN
jgi:hypothetical protein